MDHVLNVLLVQYGIQIHQNAYMYVDKMPIIINHHISVNVLMDLAFIMEYVTFVQITYL